MHFPCFIISAMNDSDLIEKRIEGEEVFHGKLLHVFHDKVLLPNGLPHLVLELMYRRALA